jgi:hypothetical protein
MADARDRRNGIGRVRLLYSADTKQEFMRMARALRDATGAASVDAVVMEAVRRAHESRATEVGAHHARGKDR